MKLMLMMLSFFIVLSGNEGIWLNNYKEALVKAKMEQKPIVVIMTKEHCQWCKKLEDNTLEDEGVAKKLATKFINVLLVRESSQFPNYLKAKIFPTTFFVTNKEKVVHKMPGYWGIEDYNSIIDDALRKIKKIEEK